MAVLTTSQVIQGQTKIRLQIERDRLRSTVMTYLFEEICVANEEAIYIKAVVKYKK